MYQHYVTSVLFHGHCCQEWICFDAPLFNSCLVLDKSLFSKASLDENLRAALALSDFMQPGSGVDC